MLEKVVKLVVFICRGRWSVNLSYATKKKDEFEFFSDSSLVWFDDNACSLLHFAFFCSLVSFPALGSLDFADVYLSVEHLFL